MFSTGHGRTSGYGCSIHHGRVGPGTNPRARRFHAWREDSAQEAAPKGRARPRTPPPARDTLRPLRGLRVAPFVSTSLQPGLTRDHFEVVFPPQNQRGNARGSAAAASAQLGAGKVNT